MGKIAKNQKKLPKRIKEDIRLRFSVNGETLKDLSEEYGVNYSYITHSKIVILIQYHFFYSHNLYISNHSKIVILIQYF